MRLRDKAEKAWEDKKSEQATGMREAAIGMCESAVRSFQRLTGIIEYVPVCWVDDDGRTNVRLDGLFFMHARKPHAWWLKGKCPECGEEGWSVSFGEDGLWQVGALLERFEVAGHMCPVEEVKEKQGEPTAAEQLKEAVVRIINEWEG